MSEMTWANHETRIIGPDASTQATLGIGASDKFAFPQLTKRELFAALAMNSLISRCAETGADDLRGIESHILAAWSVEYANELIKALAK